MQNNTSYRSQLYKNLIGSGKVSANELGNEDSFINNLSSPDIAKQLYGKLSTVFSKEEIGDENQFVSSITPDFQGQPLAVNPFINPPKMDEVAPMIDEGGKFVRPEPADIDRKLSELNTNPMLKRYEDLQNKRAEKENIMRYSGGDALVSPIEVFRAIKRSNVSADDEKFLNENKSQAEKLINDRKALLLQKEFIQLADNLNKYDDNKSAVEKFWTGLTKTGTLKDFASLGLTAMARNMNLLGVLKKAENNEPVTDEEQKMLQTYNYLKEIESSQDPSSAYKAGVIVQNAIPFIANMIISGGALGGVRAGISSALKVGTWEAAKQSVKGATTYGLKKLAEGAIFNAVRSPLTTTVAKSLSENVVDRYQTDENGKVVFDPNAPSDLKMLYDTYMQNYLEYFTEELGGAFTGDVAKTFVAPIFRNSPKIKALFGSSINALNKLGGNKYAKAVKEVTDLAQIQGLVGENMEEVANAGLSTVLTGSQDWKQFTDNPSELIGLTSINTLLLGGAFAAARYGAAGPSTVIENTKNKKQFFKATNELSAEIEKLNSMIPELNAQTEAINADEASRITEKAKQIAELAGKGQFSGPDNYTENSPVMLNLTEFNSMTDDPAYDGVRAALSKVISTAAIKSGNYIGLAEMTKREIGDFENKTAKNSVIIATDNDGNSFYVIDQLEQPDGKDPILIVRPTSGGDAITVTSADFTGEKGGVAMFSTEEFIDQYLQAREGLVQQTGQAINNQIDSSPVEPQPLSQVNVGENYFLAGNPVSVIDITEDAVFVKDQDGNIHDVQVDDLEAAPPVTNQQVPLESATISEEQPIQQEQLPENTQQQEQEQQVDEIPLTKDGQPDYDAMEPEMLTKYLKNELSPEDSIVILGDVVKSLEQSRKNISKRSTKGVNEAIAKRKQLKEIDDKIEKYNIAISNLSSPEAFDDQGEVLTEEDIFKRDFNNLLMRIRTHNMQTPGKKKSSNIAPFLIKANRLGLTIRPDMYNNLEIIDKDGNVLNRLFSSKKDRTDVDSHKTLSEYDEDMQTFVKVMIADPEHIVFIVKLDRNTIAQGVRDILSETRSVASNSLLDALDEIFKSGEVEVKSPFGNPETVSLYQYLNDVLSVDQLTDEQINEDMPDDILEDMPDFSINSNNISENDNNAEQAQSIQTTLNNEEAAINEQQSGAAEQSPEQRGDSNPVAETQASTELSQLETIQAEIAAEEAKVNTNPTEAQKEAGNYQKGHITIQGFDVTIENPKGSIRSGIDNDGEKWEQKMNNSYGYILGTTGRDSDHIDVFLGENPLSEKVFVIDQINKDKSFDEHKVMLGFDDIEQAKAAYLSNYEDGWQGLGNITETNVTIFNDWAKADGKRIKPFAVYKINTNFVNNEKESPYKQKENGSLSEPFRQLPDGVSFVSDEGVHSLPGQIDLWREADYTAASDNGLNNISYLERQLVKKNIELIGDKLTGSAKIKSSADVAFLFKNLERASTENVFAVLIKPNGSYTVLWVSHGATNASVVDTKLIVTAAVEHGADRVVLVHNHPSGNLTASRGDINMQDQLSTALKYHNITALPGVIINLDSGKYSEFSNDRYFEILEKKEQNGRLINAKIYSFDRLLLYTPSSERTKIRNSKDVAIYLSKMKRGTTPKMGALVLNQSNEITRAIFFDETASMSDISKQLLYEVGKYGESVILHTNKTPNPELATTIQNALKTINSNLLDIIQADQAEDIVDSYKSFAEEGLLNESPILYNDKSNSSIELPDKITIDGVERSTKNNLGESSGNDVMYRDDDVEISKIKEEAIANGTFMKAPNGKPTNLNETQWVQVRTGAFKNWFGDWEKTLRIEKLRNSKPVEITGNEYKGKYDLDAESAQKWIKDNLRSKYIIKDTGESISITRVGAEEVTSHNRFDETHLKSIASIPELLSNAIFIEEQPSNKTNSKYDSYRYYVVGVKFDGVDYTVKVVIGVKQGKKYYDHRLTEMEKTKLIDIINQPASDFTSAGNASLPPYITAKDTKLISILQINSSKIIDDNGRPLLVYHGTPNKSGFTVFDKNQIGTSNDNGIWGVGFYFSPLKKQADQYRNNNGDLYTAYLSVKNPFKISDYNSIKEIADYLGMEEANFTNESTGIRPIYSQINQFTSHVIEKGHDGVISEKTNEIVVFEPNQIKSATDNNGEFNPNSEDIRFRSPYFYSPTEQALNSIKQEKATPEQWKAMLLKNGAKQAEMDWMGFDDFTDGKNSLTKADIQDWINQNKIEVKEMTKGEITKVTKEDVESVRFKDFGSGSYVIKFKDSDLGSIEISTQEADNEQDAIKEALDRANYDDSGKIENKTKFSQYVLPGGENYRELLLTMPEFKDVPNTKYIVYRDNGGGKYSIIKGTDSLSEAKDLAESQPNYDYNIRDEFVNNSSNNFKSSHFEEPNILAHVRFDERTGKNGEKILFIEEIQSDWAQKGKKEGFKGNIKELPYNYEVGTLGNNFYIVSPDSPGGYVSSGKTYEEARENALKYLNGKAIIDMPFKKTDQWVNLALRRMMIYAAENNFDVIAWTNGEQQADRYDLSKQVNEILYRKDGENNYYINIKLPGNNLVAKNNQTQHDLENLVGKEVASKIINGEKEGKLSGLDLKVGGEGMKAFYDEIVPNAANKIGKPFGAKVETVEIPNIGNQQSIPITEKIKEQAEIGMPLFKNYNLDAINDKFNQDIQKQFNNELQYNHVYQLGRPGEILLSAGLRDSNIIMSQKTLKEHIKKHSFSVSELLDLPKYLQSPLMIYQWGEKAKSLIVITEIKREDQRITVALKIERSGKEIEINEIASVHGKDIDRLINEINTTRTDFGKNNLRWVNKEKALDWLGLAPPEGASSLTDPELYAANVINSFQNPTLKQGETISEIEALTNDLNIPIKIVKEIAEIPTSQVRKRKSKGWYNPKTGEIVVVLPNHTNIADIQATILHEAVAHKGLRNLLGDQFKPMMQAVFDSMSENSQVTYLAQYKDPVTAAEEYCANIAERDIEPTTWEKIKSIIKDAFRAIGVDLRMTDADIAFMLWRSKNRLKAEKTATVKERMEDIAAADKMKEQLKFRERPETNDITLSWSEQKIETWQDKMVSVRKLIDEIEKRGGKVAISANPYIQENLSSSRAKAEADKFIMQLWKPLLNHITDIEKNYKVEYKSITKYLMAKHAPERNRSICVNEVVMDIKNKVRSNDVTSLLAKYPNLIRFEAMRKYDSIVHGVEPDLQTYENTTEGELKELSRIRKSIDKLITEITESKVGTNRSGISNEDAAVIVKKFESTVPIVDINQLWALIKRSTNFTVDTWKKYGLISNEQYKAMTEFSMFKHYVPLRGWEEKEDIDYSEFARDYMGSSILNLNKKSEGRTSLADDPLAYIASMAESAIISGNKNEIRRAAWRMVAANKEMDYLFILRNTWYVNVSETEDSKWVEVFEKPAQQLFDEGRVRTNIDTSYDWHKTSQELGVHSVPVFIDGQRMIIEFKGEIGAKAAMAINRLNSESIGKLFSVATNMNRWIAANLTSKNPDFMLTNFTRDYFFGNISYFVKGGSIANLNKNIAIAFKAIHNDRFGKNQDNDVQKMYDDFKMNGGQTGYIHLNGVEQYKKDIERLRLHASGVYPLGDRVLRNKLMTAGANALEYMALMSENAMRFAVYKTEIERMMKEANVSEPTQNMKTLAAKAAKDITVNFNRRGAQDNTLSGLLGSMFAFFNAAIQGTTTFFKLAKENPSRFSIAMSSLIGMSFLGSLFSALLSGGDDDDKEYDRLSDYAKFNNIILLNPLSSGKDEFFTIPTPHGFRAFASIGPLAVDVIRGKRNEVDALWELSKNIATEISPLSLSGFDLSRPNSSAGILSFITPTMLRPVIEVYPINQDYMGNEISKKPFLSSQEGIIPQWQLAPKSTNKILVGISKMINNLAGGTDNISSSVPRKVGRSEPYGYGFFTDFNPAKIEHIFEGYLGGRLRFWNDMYKTANSILEKEVPDKQNIPVFRRLYQGAKQKSGWPEFYETRDYVEQINARMKDYKDRGDIEGQISINNYYNAQIIAIFKSYEKPILEISKNLNDVNYKAYKKQLEDQRDFLLKDFEQKIHELNKTQK